MQRNTSHSFHNLPDAELLRHVREQSADKGAAFSALYDRHHKRIITYSVALLGRTDGNDALQETFIRFYKLAQTSDIDSVPAMLTTIARNVCIDLKRRRKNVVALEEDLLATQRGSQQAHHSYEQQELMQLLELGLEHLDFDVREAFVLRHYQGLSYQEIAELTDVPETTVTKRIWRAKERLKHVLSPFINDVNQF
jgi:RNA polymerase sigma-70 factor, ECF subfamily